MWIVFEHLLEKNELLFTPISGHTEKDLGVSLTRLEGDLLAAEDELQCAAQVGNKNLQNFSPTYPRRKEAPIYPSHLINEPNYSKEEMTIKVTGLCTKWS